MPYSQSQKKATIKWMTANYERIYLRVPKGFKQEVIEASQQQNYASIRAFILDAIKEKMGKE